MPGLRFVYVCRFGSLFYAAYVISRYLQHHITIVVAK